MSVTGSLADFSLPEIFQFIEKGRKTGLLTLSTVRGAQATLPRLHYIWVYQGQVIAASQRLDQQGLVSLIQQSQWVSDRVITKLVQLCPIDKSLGLCLKKQGVLQTEQLKRLFQLQVLRPVSALFQLEEGEFHFDSQVPPPTREMTGLTMSATGVTLMGLRRLKNWNALADKLPEANNGLISSVSGHPRQRLAPSEWQVWEYTKGTVSLKAIAKQLQLPVEQVQQIAFRLISVGLAEEYPLLTANSSAHEVKQLPTQLIQEAQRQNVSHSFLHSLVGFLRSKV